MRRNRGVLFVLAIMSAMQIFSSIFRREKSILFHTNRNNIVKNYWGRCWWHCMYSDIQIPEDNTILIMNEYCSVDKAHPTALLQSLFCAVFLLHVWFSQRSTPWNVCQGTPISGWLSWSMGDFFVCLVDFFSCSRGIDGRCCEYSQPSPPVRSEKINKLRSSLKDTLIRQMLSSSCFAFLLLQISNNRK